MRWRFWRPEELVSVIMFTVGPSYQWGSCTRDEARKKLAKIVGNPLRVVNAGKSVPYLYVYAEENNLFQTMTADENIFSMADLRHNLSYYDHGESVWKNIEQKGKCPGCNSLRIFRIFEENSRVQCKSCSSVFEIEDLKYPPALPTQSIEEIIRNVKRIKRLEEQSESEAPSREERPRSKRS